MHRDRLFRYGVLAGLGGSVTIGLMFTYPVLSMVGLGLMIFSIGLIREDLIDFYEHNSEDYV